MEWRATIYRHANYYRAVVTDGDGEDCARYVFLVPFHEYERTPAWDGAEQAAIDLVRPIIGDGVGITYEYEDRY